MASFHAHVSVSEMPELIRPLLVNIRHGVSKSLLPNDLIRATLGPPHHHGIWRLEGAQCRIICCLTRNPGGG